MRKKDRTHRFCVDYRALNEVTKLDTYPLPRVDDLLDQLGGAKFFTTLDLASGFWQIRVAKESQEKTAFVVPQGLFEFRVMPFGLTNAPAVLQRLMQRVFAGLNPIDGQAFVAVYTDDVLIFSRSFNDHLLHLSQVLERIRMAGLKLKITKCGFVHQETKYLGHIITSNGLNTDPKLVQAIMDYPPPKNVREVRQFLGLCSYYRRFILSFAAITHPIRMLTRKEKLFCWDEKCEKSFEQLKQRLTTAPILSYPSLNDPFMLETDACAHGIGAILSQSQGDGFPHPIAYASRSLTKLESNYSITELETLAGPWTTFAAICMDKQ